MKFRLHIGLFLLAIPPVLIGGSVLDRCAFDRSYDSNASTCISTALMFLVLAATLIGFALYDARSSRRH